MPPIQVKDCPKEVYEGLKRCASRENRNLSQEMLHILGLYIDTHAESPKAHSHSKKQTGSLEDDSSSANHTLPHETKFTNAIATAYVGTNYDERSAYDTASDRIERRKAAFARIAKMPAFTPKNDGITTVDLLRESHKEAR